MYIEKNEICILPPYGLLQINSAFFRNFRIFIQYKEENSKRRSYTDEQTLCSTWKLKVILFLASEVVNFGL